MNLTLELEQDTQLRAVDELDLSRIRRKMLKEEPYSEEEVDRAISVYRMYLKLCVNHKGLGVPNLIVDKVWHHHILDTVRYHADCESVFGYYFHHCPSSFLEGEVGEQEKARSKSAHDKTVQLLRDEFGEGIISEAYSCYGNPCRGTCGGIGD